MSELRLMQGEGKDPSKGPHVAWAVKVVLDLGALRDVEAINIFWGNAQILPMPLDWELAVAATADGYETHDDANGKEPAMLPKLVGAESVFKVHKVILQADGYDRHYDEVTANFIDANVPGSGRWPKKLRYVELRLNAPQYPAGLLGYAVRCVQVVGPPVERGLSVKVREAAGVPKAE